MPDTPSDSPSSEEAEEASSSASHSSSYEPPKITELGALPESTGMPASAMGTPSIPMK